MQEIERHDKKVNDLYVSWEIHNNLLLYTVSAGFRIGSEKSKKNFIDTIIKEVDSPKLKKIIKDIMNKYNNAEIILNQLQSVLNQDQYTQIKRIVQEKLKEYRKACRSLNTIQHDFSIEVSTAPEKVTYFKFKLDDELSNYTGENNSDPEYFNPLNKNLFLSYQYTYHVNNSVLLNKYRKGAITIKSLSDKFNNTEYRKLILKKLYDNFKSSGAVNTIQSNLRKHFKNCIGDIKFGIPSDVKN